MNFRITLIILGFVIAGCASQQPVKARGTEIHLRYGEIVDIERVQLPSAAPVGAVVGGFTGLALSRNRSGRSQIGSGIGGAVLGGLATRALEGDRLGYSYRIRYLNGSESDFITEKGYLQIGDCVTVESGNYQNLRRVSRGVCESSDALRAPAVPLQRSTARQCHDAKEQLLIAQGPQEVTEAARKVEIICHF